MTDTQIRQHWLSRVRSNVMRRFAQVSSSAQHGTSGHWGRAVRSSLHRQSPRGRRRLPERRHGARRPPAHPHEQLQIINAAAQIKLGVMGYQCRITVTARLREVQRGHRCRHPVSSTTRPRRIRPWNAPSTAGQAMQQQHKNRGNGWRGGLKRKAPGCSKRCTRWLPGSTDLLPIWMTLLNTF